MSETEKSAIKFNFSESEFNHAQSLMIDLQLQDFNEFFQIGLFALNWMTGHRKAQHAVVAADINHRLVDPDFDFLHHLKVAKKIRDLDAYSVEKRKGSKPAQRPESAGYEIYYELDREDTDIAKNLLIDLKMTKYDDLFRQCAPVLQWMFDKRSLKSEIATILSEYIFEVTEFDFLPHLPSHDLRARAFLDRPISGQLAAKMVM